jgi:hypothetical protein
VFLQEHVSYTTVRTIIYELAGPVSELQALQKRGRRRYLCRYFAIAKAAMNNTQNATAWVSSFQPNFLTANGPGFWMK